MSFNVAKVAEIRRPRKVWDEKTKTDKFAGFYKTPVGVAVYFDDVNPGLEQGQKVLEEKPEGGLQEIFAHGTRVFYSYKHQTYSVTTPTTPAVTGWGMRTEGDLVVVQPETRNGGQKDNGGRKEAKFRRDYPQLAFTIDVLQEEKALRDMEREDAELERLAKAA